MFNVQLKLRVFIVFFGLCGLANAQTSDYFGNGNTTGITVTTSDASSSTDATNTVVGLTSYIFDEADAVRFLQQSTLGYDYEDVQNLYSQGIESWMDEQMTMTERSFSDAYLDLRDFSESVGAVLPNHTDGYIGYTFYDKVINDDDQFRLKIGFALSQLLVISFDNPTTDRMSDAFTDYFDIFYNQAFGNFRDILYDVTMHKTMGLYLSYINNKKEDVEAGTFPDENFAREIMQLFTIGLYELNNDATLKYDADGNTIATYDNEDIVQLAKVFTGLVQDNDSFSMTVNESNHDVGEKIMIDGTILPANQTTLEDVNAALDILFNHDNMAPFLSRHLIKQMVKSNPTAAYINRVANIFNNNGQGVRGDMEAVFKAILLDDEARNCPSLDSAGGKLLQPLEKFMFLFKALHLSSPSGKKYMVDYLIWNGDQRILGSPTVFNFFDPFYAEPTVVTPLGLVSPEFELFNSVSAIQYYNNVKSAIKNVGIIRNYTVSNTNGDGLAINSDDSLYYDLSFEENLYETEGVAALVDHYNLLLCRNQLTEPMQLIIEDAINQYEEEVNNYDAYDAVTDVVMFITTSPVFGVLN